MHKINAFLFFHEAKRGQRGQVAAFLIIIMVIILVAATALIQIGKTSQRRLATANAADAAALAGASTLASSANMVSVLNNDLIAKFFFGNLLPAFFTLLFPVDFRKENSYFNMYLITSGLNILIYLQLLIAGRDAITQSMAAAHQYAFSNVGIEEAPIRKKSDPYAPLKQPFSEWMEKPKNCSGDRKESFQDDDCFMYRWTEHTFVPQEGTEDGGVHEADPAYSSWAKSEVDMGADGFQLKAWSGFPLINKYRYYYIPCCKDIPYLNVATCLICGVQLDEWTALNVKLKSHDKRAKLVFLALMSIATGMSGFQDIGVVLADLYLALNKAPLVYFYPKPSHPIVDCTDRGCLELLKNICGIGDWATGKIKDLSGGKKASLAKCLASLKNLIGGFSEGTLGSPAEKQLAVCEKMLRFWEAGPNWMGWVPFLSCLKSYWDKLKDEPGYVGCLSGIFGSENTWLKAITCIQDWKKTAWGIDIPLPYYEVTVLYVVPIPFIEGISNIDRLFVESTVTRHSPEKNLNLWNMEVPDVSSTAEAKVGVADDTACAQRGFIRIMPCFDLELTEAD